MVDRDEAGEDRRLDDVGADSAAAVEARLVRDLDEHLAERLAALGDGLQLVLLEDERVADDLLDGPQRGVDRPGARRDLLVLLLAPAEGDAGRAGHAVAAVDDEAVEPPHLLRVGHGGAGALHEGHEVAVLDRLLAVGEHLEGLEEVAQFLVRRLVAEFGEPLAEGVLTRVLAEHEGRLEHADRLGRHDLVRPRVSQHAVLVDARLVGEGVLADDRLVGRELDAGDRREQARGAEEFFRPDVVRASEVVGARAQRHDNLLEGRVAGAFADAADRALDLARAGPDAGQRVGHAEPEVVVAVHGEDRPVHVGYARVHGVDHGVELVRRGVADGVGQVDDRGAGVDDRLGHAAEEVEVRAEGVLGAELHFRALVARVGHHAARLVERLLAGELEFVLQVQVARGDERMDSRMHRLAESPRRGVDILLQRAGEAGDGRLLHGARDGGDGFGIARRGDGKARLDDIDTQRLELQRHANLFFKVHAVPRRLLAVAQGGVEETYLYAFLHTVFLSHAPLLSRPKNKKPRWIDSTGSGQHAFAYIRGIRYTGDPGPPEAGPG